MTSILTEGWPDWVVFSLSAVFVIVGFGVMIWGLNQYHQVMELVVDEGEFQVP